MYVHQIQHISCEVHLGSPVHGHHVSSHTTGESPSHFSLDSRCGSLFYWSVSTKVSTMKASVLSLFLYLLSA